MFTDKKETTQEMIQNALELLTNPEKSLSDVLTQEFIQSICIKKNKQLMLAFKVRLEQELSQILHADEDKALLNAKVDNLLSFMAYTELEEGSQIKIPTIINQTFELVSYTVERITLTTELLGSAYKCYGLVPSSEITTYARLLFMGTTFPTAEGFTQALLADITPGGGVGYILYHQGKHTLQEWIDRQYHVTNFPVHCCGQSLGGALSMHAYIHQPTKVSFTAINPPFLSTKEKSIFALSKNESIVTNNKIYSHVLDPVADIGHWFPITATVHLHGTKEDFSGSWMHRLFKAHAAQLTSLKFKTFSGSDYLRILSTDENRMRNHYALKPAKLIAFTSLLAVAGVNSIFNSVSNYIGYPAEENNLSTETETDKSDESRIALLPK